MGIVQKLFNQLFDLQSVRKQKIEQRDNLYSNKLELLKLLKEVDQKIRNITEEIDDSNQQSDIIINQIEYLNLLDL
jgi:hypothetical protein